MKLSRSAIRETMHQLGARILGAGEIDTEFRAEAPLRSELFSAVQMEQHGKSLALSHQLTSGTASDQLLQRLKQNEQVLLAVCNLLISSVKAKCRIAPAGEWLLDNFYLIEDQIRTAKRHLPQCYSRELPRLLAGPSEKLPRVYDIALEIIAHGDGRVDPDNLSRFVAAYQTVEILKLGELWAIPIMLRLALIENLRRVASRIAASRNDQDLADKWADEMTAMAESDPKNVILVVADMARSIPPTSSAFVAVLVRRLQGHSSSLALPLTWLEQQLAESGLTTEQLIQVESQQQAADQVSIRNSIASLRFLGAMDWRDFVESMSRVEQILREDPVGTYSKMDFATRDCYRHVVERIAKNSCLFEAEVARHAVQLAEELLIQSAGDDRRAHVGYFLIDRGVAQLECRVKLRLTALSFLERKIRQFSLVIYLGVIFLLTGVFTWLLLAKAETNGLANWLQVPFCTVALIATSHLAVALVNWLATLLAFPQRLPRMDFSEGIPLESCTLVVTPTMLTSAQNIADLLESLEVRFLANNDENLLFALLTDFSDAQVETMPEDESLLLLAEQGIEALNEKYPRANGDTFFLFHRSRLWNAQEGLWMGYERKRGKLADLNAFLCGEPGERFTKVVGETSRLSNVKYVITLDTDTQLPRDAARKLVGSMAHPLNRPRYDQRKQRVCEGYGILQPRVSASLPGANRSRYARMHGTDAGIDPYTNSVSDVYQDWFKEGSYIGKGIYDVAIFEEALKSRFPENRVLSHDLLEGCYARSGLVSDVELYEDYPECYSADVSRRHRWIRGDWQIVEWLLPQVPGPDQQRHKNPLSGLSRWKLFDNLRRSFVPAALTVLFIFGWLLSSGSLSWTVLVLCLTLVPFLLTSVRNVLHKPRDASWRQYFTTATVSAGRQLGQALFTVACLPFESLFSLDAMIRSIWRMRVSHRRMLEWAISGGVLGAGKTLLAFYRMMWIGPTLAVISFLILSMGKARLLNASSFILLLWFLAPAIVWWLSRPLTSRRVRLTAEQITFLRKVSRKTWSFFEVFVGPKDNWLPPDNYQEQPVAIAHRTSPTNMGLSLLANLSAYDFGYIPAGELLERTSCALSTMYLLERYRGHFLNWYDTQSLKSLPPHYVSAVDSGNLAGHLLTLQPGLLSLLDEPILTKRWLDGLRDTFGILVDEVRGTIPPNLAEFQRTLDSLSRLALQSGSIPLVSAQIALEKLLVDADGAVRELEEKSATTAIEWAQALARQCRATKDELLFLAPWLAMPPCPMGLTECGGMQGPLGMGSIPTLRELARLEVDHLSFLQERMDSESDPEGRKWLNSLRLHVQEAGRRAKERISGIERVALQAGELAQMDYDFLYDESRHLVAIGYHVGERKQDTSYYYDLLASEARLGCFVAIAQGLLPQESWFALGRLLTLAAGEPTLMSWSGSMFEYLMPMLVMPTYQNTLLDQTCRAAVARQIEYGKLRGVPWGISESCYNRVDVHLVYQYRAFGVPGLGLKRGLADDLVVAPYASALALMVDPDEACANLQLLASAGFEGRYGFYEAIDYTPGRLLRGQTNVIIRSFMAHHQAMSLLSLSALLLGRLMQKRFESAPLFQATTLLLQERIPKTPTFYSQTTGDITNLRTTTADQEAPVRVFSSPNTPIPEVQLLSNGRYHVMVTNAGGGYSHWKDLAITRWQEDTTRDPWGTFCYLRDIASGEFWSTTYQPTLAQPESYEAIFSEGRAEYRRRDHGIESYSEIAVSPEDDIELRRVRITNRSGKRRVIEITSYAEVVIAPQVADALHPAFSNLFVQTEILHPLPAILCTRRRRSREEDPPWMFHLMAVRGAVVEDVSYETDRLKFIGRGRSVADPQALTVDESLSGTAGSVLDPIVAIRTRVTLDPEESAVVDMVFGIAESREVALGLAGKYEDPPLADRVFDLAWTHSQVVLRQLNATESDVQLYKRVANSIIYPNASLRAAASVLSKNRRGQSGLWSHAVSGDLPIVLLQIGDPANIELVQHLVQAHTYWRLKGLKVDLVIWNEDRTGYRQLLHDQILGLIAAGVEANVMDRPGGIFVRPADQISVEDRILFQTVARAIITDTRGTLAEQLRRRSPVEKRVPRLRTTKVHRAEPAKEPQLRDDLAFYNGLGGFTQDGREYVITTALSQRTPAPWVNVLANPHFGSVISENGVGYTWSENAHEFRLTPWSNDPVSDTSGEGFYLRDEGTGYFWSPTPLPCCGVTPYVSRHGFGYSVFEHTEDGIHSELWVYVAVDSSVKFSKLKVRNDSGQVRRLSATGYVEWVLGDLRSKSSLHVITEIEPTSGALLARNLYNSTFHDHVAFFDVDEASRTFTGDRMEFIGRNGTLKNPAAMTRARLSDKIGAALDSCAAIQVPFELAVGQEREIVFRLGVVDQRGAEDVSTLVHRYRGPYAARTALESVWRHWAHTLGAVQVKTPDPSLNILANGWLLYQTLACRFRARSGYYQSGGAFGFRDQLQDMMALIHAEPELVREHLLRCASRQFREGDVQHWWHPPSGRGVRTHCSDDFLWLPLATCRYVLSTGDSSVLDEPVRFLDGRPLSAEDDSYYDLPNISDEAASLYQHCVRAILRGLRFGEHGLPLMGSGDWNDGMNLVGMQGKGESVWLGFFLCEVLMQFRQVAHRQGDSVFAERCEREASQLRLNIKQHGWDGDWYRRAYFDDGTPLGSVSNLECQIDSIAQSWSVLSGAGEPERSRLAMESLNARLVRRKDRIVQLLDPPFNTSELNPGYIKGYVPGVRENGGQYTHAAIWAAMAFAKLKNSQIAWELFSLINPINHARSPDETLIYKVEPYVISADVYGVSPHIGRGGWSWYTGSAGWMYRLILESLLGLRLEGDTLHFSPCLPEDWTHFKVQYRYRETIYHISITVAASGDVTPRVLVDGVESSNPWIVLVDDHQEHQCEVKTCLPSS